MPPEKDRGGSSYRLRSSDLLVVVVLLPPLDLRIVAALLPLRRRSPLGRGDLSLLRLDLVPARVGGQVGGTVEELLALFAAVLDVRDPPAAVLGQLERVLVQLLAQLALVGPDAVLDLGHLGPGLVGHHHDVELVYLPGNGDLVGAQDHGARNRAAGLLVELELAHVLLLRPGSLDEGPVLPRGGHHHRRGGHLLARLGWRGSAGGRHRLVVTSGPHQWWWWWRCAQQMLVGLRGAEQQVLLVVVRVVAGTQGRLGHQVLGSPLDGRRVQGVAVPGREAPLTVDIVDHYLLLGVLEGGGRVARVGVMTAYLLPAAAVFLVVDLDGLLGGRRLQGQVQRAGSRGAPALLVAGVPGEDALLAETSVGLVVVLVVVGHERLEHVLEVAAQVARVDPGLQGAVKHDV